MSTRVDVTITLEVDEPDLGKREKYARKFMEDHLAQVPTYLLEEYAIVDQPVVRTAKSDGDIG